MITILQIKDQNKFISDMVIIERSYMELKDCDGARSYKEKRRCFADDDIEGVEKFINKDPPYKDAWKEVKAMTQENMNAQSD